MTADAATLRALIARLEAGETEDSLCRDILIVTDMGFFRHDYLFLGKSLLTSVDAALAFTKKVLPRWRWTVWERGAQVCLSDIIREKFREDGRQPAAALVLATLKAKLAEVDEG